MIASAGSPGISLSPKKISVATAQSTKAPPSTRLTTQRTLPAQPDVVERRGRHGRHRPQAIHRVAHQEVVLLVVERQDVEAAQDLLLNLLVEVSTLLRVGHLAGLREERIHLGVTQLGEVREVAARRRDD